MEPNKGNVGINGVYTTFRNLKFVPDDGISPFIEKTCKVDSALNEVIATM